MAEPVPHAGAASRPLAGVRVLDLSLLLPGPFCTLLLADLGADVIKVEPPAGDGTRVSPTEIHPVVNRDKRSVVLDLKTEEGRERCLRLASTADVFIEGFRPGVVTRLGVDYERIKAVRAGIIYCSISGFGQTGPRAKAPGHDVNYLAVSGALSFSGQWRRTGPQRPGLPLADLSASMYAAVSILAALRRRDHGGEGAYIDIGMADCAMAFAAVRGGESQRLEDSERKHLFPSNGVFRCADGRFIALGAVEDHFWTRFVAVAEELSPQLASTRFCDDAGRRAHGDELLELLSALFESASCDEWLRRFDTVDVPLERVLRLEEAVETQQVEDRALVQWCDGQRHVLFPALWNGQPIAAVSHNAPALGEHTNEVIKELEEGQSKDMPYEKSQD